MLKQESHFLVFRGLFTRTGYPATRRRSKYVLIPRAPGICRLERSMLREQKEMQEQHASCNRTGVSITNPRGAGILIDDNGPVLRSPRAQGLTLRRRRDQTATVHRWCSKTAPQQPLNLWERKNRPNPYCSVTKHKETLGQTAETQPGRPRGRGSVVER